MANQTEYTVTQAAKQLGANVSTIRKYAAALDAPRLGRQYRLTAEHIATMRESLNTWRPGPRAADDKSEFGATKARQRSQAIAPQRPLPRRRGMDGGPAGVKVRAPGK